MDIGNLRSFLREGCRLASERRQTTDISSYRHHRLVRRTKKYELPEKGLEIFLPQWQSAPTSSLPNLALFGKWKHVKSTWRETRQDYTDFFAKQVSAKKTDVCQNVFTVYAFTYFVCWTFVVSFLHSRIWIQQKDFFFQSLTDNHSLIVVIFSFFLFLTATWNYRGASCLSVLRRAFVASVTRNSAYKNLFFFTGSWGSTKLRACAHIIVSALGSESWLLLGLTLRKYRRAGFHRISDVWRCCRFSASVGTK